MSRRIQDQNKNARIREVVNQGRLEVSTSNRDTGTLTASAIVRERSDVQTGRSLTGFNIRTSGGRNINFSGLEARTLFRVLEQAVRG
jgi:hypothetical protein